VQNDEKPLSRNRCADFTFKQNSPINAWVIVRGNTVLAFRGFRSGVAKGSVLLGYSPALMGDRISMGQKGGL
jgi:ribosomal protein L39E